MSFDVISVFIFVSALLAISPGPDNLYVLNQSAQFGRRAGILITLGLCSGLFVHIAAVCLGLAALLKTTPVAFIVLKAIGASYLLFLAWQMLKAKPSLLQHETHQEQPALKLIGRGFLMNVTNPKVAIFFLALLPQFVNHQAGHVTAQLITLGFLFMITAFVIFSLLAIFSEKLGRLLKSSLSAQLWLNRITALVFVLLSVNLAFSSL